jgi:hypothetical protein
VTCLVPEHKPRSVINSASLLPWTEYRRRRLSEAYLETCRWRCRGTCPLWVSGRILGLEAKNLRLKVHVTSPQPLPLQYQNFAERQGRTFELPTSLTRLSQPFSLKLSCKFVRYQVCQDASSSGSSQHASWRTAVWPKSSAFKHHRRENVNTPRVFCCAWTNKFLESQISSDHVSVPKPC